MKKILILWLLAISTFAQAQSIQDLVFKSDLQKVTTEIQKANTRIDSLKKAIGSPVTPPPVAQLPPCDRGPTISGISKITSISLTLNFDGQNVFSIAYKIAREDGSLIVPLDSVRPTNNTPTIAYPPLSNGSYRLYIWGRSCTSEVVDRKFTVTTDGGVIPPPVDPIPVTPGAAPNIGTESIKAGGRTYTYNLSGEMVLGFNADGTISDITPELDNSGSITKHRGQNVFYMIDYSVLSKPDESYEKFQNIRLPDGAFTVKQFICNPVKIPTIKVFKDNLTSNGDNGVHELNARMSQIMVSIHSDQKVGNGLVPEWLVLSRKMNFPQYTSTKDWYPYAKWFSVGFINKDDIQITYQRVGVNPYVQVGNPINQSGTWSTVKTAQNRIMSRQEAYNYGREHAGYMGASPRSYITEELIENGQGGYGQHNPDGSEKTPDGYVITYQFAKGNFDIIKERSGVSNPRLTGVHGGYGGDEFYGLLNYNLLFGNRKVYEQSMTDKLYKGYGFQPATTTFGFSDADHPYYTDGHIDVRNVNLKYYPWNRLYYLPYELIYLNERFALATGTYGGQDRRRGISYFTADKVESFVMKPGFNEKINIEETLSGEVINFPNGQLISKLNAEPAANWGHQFEAGFWSALIIDGFAMWSAPGSTFGSDPTKVNVYSDQYFGWKKTGENNFQRYQSGVNGAPENSQNGLMNSLFAPQFDAAVAGMEAAWNIRDRTTKLSFVSYRSSLGEFIAKPGTAGFHLNGSGPANYNSFTVRDAWEQGKGIALIGEGTGGVVLIYHNDFVSAQNYEENVTIRYAGVDYNLGRVYGHQTVIRKL